MTSLAEQYGICDKKSYDAWADAHQPDAVTRMLMETRIILAEQSRLNAQCLRRASLERERMLRKDCDRREAEAFARVDALYGR